VVVVVVGVAGATLGIFVVAVAVVGVGCGATLIISKSSSGSFRDVLEPLGRPFGPRVFAVVLYLALGAVAQTVLELDVHVVYGALIRYRGARGDLIVFAGPRRRICNGAHRRESSVWERRTGPCSLS